MRSRNTIVSGSVAIIAAFAAPAHATTVGCDADTRAVMVDVNHAVPMRQNVITEMGDTTIESAALSTPDGRGMALDANDNPVSLWIGGRFYTTADGGETWTLLREQSEAELDQQAANLRRQAEEATGFICDYDIALDGRTVHRFEAEYVLIPSGVPARSRYWVDAETGFPWKVMHEFGGDAPMTITQQNEPVSDLTIPDPER
ncbi:MAG: hypothetical protein RIB53_07425 [Roseitalea porphyridii]|jgi:hypothetical protein|uniref:hypothetical protein n=1 Tax=Roseitalea porphyridii TaxID=1852022 RepID=UPI0032EB5E58